MKAPEGGEFLVLTPNYWGRGKTKVEAKRNARKAGAASGAPYLLFHVKGTYEVSELDGAITHEKGKLKKLFEKPKKL